MNVGYEQIVIGKQAMMKKKWLKPQLTILVRGTSEEAVLAACKNNNAFGSDGPNGKWNCMPPGGNSAQWCFTQNSS
jgi:hypothetical protein